VRTQNAIGRGRVRAIEDAVETWRFDHDDALAVRDVEDVVRECLGMREFLRSWQNQAWAYMLANRLANIQETGEELRTELNRMLEIFPKVLAAIRWAKAKGYVFELEDQVEAAVADVKKMSQDLAFSRWLYTVLQPASVTPLPMGRPSRRYSA
jgi:hypothetical protein